jgi:hypothetical protein
LRIWVNCSIFLTVLVVFVKRDGLALQPSRCVSQATSASGSMRATTKL